MAAADPQKHQLSEAEHQRIFDERIKPEIFAGAKTLERPTAVIFGGQPGAGKSTGVDAAKNELQSKGGAVEIIGDDMRGFHPSYGSLMAQDDKTAAFYTDRDSGKWVEKAIAEAKRLKVNVVIEGTMRDGNTVAQTMNGLRTAGYEIDARVVAVNYQFSEQGILQRYEAQKADRGAGRMTAPEAHRAAYDGMLATIDRIEGEKLADRLSVYRRGNEVIYTNEVKGGEWVHEPKARAVVQSERDRSMTLQERQKYAQGYDRLAEQVTRPDRQATSEEVRKIDDLRRQAKLALAAEVFRQDRPENAVKEHPELAPAYAYLRATEAKAEADGLNNQQRRIVMGRVRENVAAQIEKGHIPNVKIREAQEVKTEQSKDRGPER